MRGIVKAFRRPPAVRLPDRNGGFPRLSGGVAQGLRCPASPRHALLAESLGKPSLWVIIKDLWYYPLDGGEDSLRRRRGIEGGVSRVPAGRGDGV